MQQTTVYEAPVTNVHKETHNCMRLLVNIHTTNLPGLSAQTVITHDTKMQRLQCKYRPPSGELAVSSQCNVKLIAS